MLVSNEFCREQPLSHASRASSPERGGGPLAVVGFPGCNAPTSIHSGRSIVSTTERKFPDSTKKAMEKSRAIGLPPYPVSLDGPQWPTPSCAGPAKKSLHRMSKGEV